MTKKVVLYGNGASARGFLTSDFSEYQVIAIATETPKINQFEGLDIIATEDIARIEFDIVIVASWAIHEITERLSRIGIGKEKILWFQHHKHRLLPWGHPDFFQSHEEVAQEQILYAVYDMNVARATYDIIGFLCLAECARLERGLSAIHVIIVNASNNEFNRARWGLQNKNEHEWRIQHILVPCCALLPSCKGVSKTVTRAEVNKLINTTKNVFPFNYNESQPVIEYEFDLLFNRVNRGQEIAHLRATQEALNLVSKSLSRLNPENKKLITVSLRESTSKPLRNSKKDQWLAFLEWLDKEQYLPIVIPDTENAFLSPDDGFREYLCLDVAAFNVEFRMALYELSYLNLGVNNGPIHLCALSKNCDYIMYKQVVEHYPHSSSKSFIDRGFTIGGGFPGAGKRQKFVWEDDDFQVLKHHFCEFVSNDEKLIYKESN